MFILARPSSSGLHKRGSYRVEVLWRLLESPRNLQFLTFGNEFCSGSGNNFILFFLLTSRVSLIIWTVRSVLFNLLGHGIKGWIGAQNERYQSQWKPVGVRFLSTYVMILSPKEHESDCRGKGVVGYPQMCLRPYYSIGNIYRLLTTYICTMVDFYLGLGHTKGSEDNLHP